MKAEPVWRCGVCNASYVSLDHAEDCCAKEGRSPAHTVSRTAVSQFIRLLGHYIDATLSEDELVGLLAQFPQELIDMLPERPRGDRDDSLRDNIENLRAAIARGDGIKFG